MLDALGIEQTALVSNDMGSQVAFAFAAQHGERVTRWVQMEAPIPGIGPWDEITSNPRTWHFGFGGPDMERLIAGRERIYLDHFWNDLPPTPAPSAKRCRSTTPRYARPGAIRAGFAPFTPSRKMPRTTRGSSKTAANSLSRCWPWAVKRLPEAGQR